MAIELKFLTFGFAVLVLFTGCSTVHKSTQSKSSAIEQLLLSESVTKSLPRRLEIPMSIPLGAEVYVDISGISADKQIVREIVVGWLGRQGYHAQNNKQDAQYQVSILVEALGTEYGKTFVGLPPTSSSILPISVPELAIFKAQYQTGYTKFYLDIFELPSGRYIQTVSPFIADTYYNEYVVLFLFTFKSTDLLSPPQVGTIGQHQKAQTTLP